MLPYNNEHVQVFYWLIVIVKKDIWSVGVHVHLNVEKSGQMFP